MSQCSVLARTFRLIFIAIWHGGYYTSDEEEWRDRAEGSGAEIASVIGNLLHEAGRPPAPASLSLDLVPATAGCMIKSVSGGAHSHWGRGIVI